MRLLKTRRVLDWYADDGQTVLFHNPEAEDGATLFPLSQETYEDMGRPEQITVTIEPGDLLKDSITCVTEAPK